MNSLNNFGQHFSRFDIIHSVTAMKSRISKCCSLCSHQRAVSIHLKIKDHQQFSMKIIADRLNYCWSHQNGPSRLNSLSSQNHRIVYIVCLCIWKQLFNLFLVTSFKHFKPRVENCTFQPYFRPG